MSKMHAEEFDIDASLVRELVNAQCAKEWSILPIQKVMSYGTDNALFRLGKNYVVRLPRLLGSDHNINKEYEWVPKLALLLNTAISVPVFKGCATDYYPSTWMVSKWNDGYNPDFEVENEYQSLAKDLAFFLNQLHGISLPQGPLSRRGLPLNVVDEEMCMSIEQLKGEIDTKWITNIWKRSLSLPNWDKESVWIHGDFLPGNILIQNHRLSAVLDFSDLGIGDPACDCVIAWALFNERSRKIFKECLENIDENTWLRGRAWALSIAVIMLPYYRDTNPALVVLANRIIAQILSSI